MPASKATNEIPSKRVGKSVADFRAAHDASFIVPQKIREALKKLGPKGWEYEQDFMRLTTPPISQTHIGQYREQFSEFWFVVGGHSQRRVWCGSKDLADELRAMV